MILLLLISLLLLLILWASLPRFGRRKAALALSRVPYAHRGLWDMEQQIPENSLPAFARAVEHHYGIELDVHLTADRQLVVFHDDTLLRMCRVDRPVEQMTYDEISRLPLLETDCHAPLLSEVLALVRGQVPLLIELKLPNRDLSLCPALADLLEDYRGDYLIESFHPLGLHWFRKHRPEILRGQLASKYHRTGPPGRLLKAASTQLLLNWLSRPDFIAYSCKNYGTPGSRLHRRLFRTPFWVWTIRSEKAFLKSSRKFDGIIFEKILPEIGEER